MPRTNNKQKIPVKQEESLFIQLFSRYIFYWPLFLILTTIFAAAAFIYLRYTTPLYEATATLIIKDEKKWINYIEKKGILRKTIY
jgi:uncharacterized protein involved in exopolysaccharide biosynthesis